MVEFLLLGDVQARLDGRRVEIGHDRQRCVLAALLVDANQPVPAEQLLDRVWGDRLPHRARGTLYSYLSRLRQVLAGVEGVGIVRQPGGYVFAVDPMAVDLFRFHRLRTQALSAEDDRAAAALLEQALGLWRGEAFATLDTPWLNGVRAALDRHRLAAELDRNDLVLGRGEHARLLGELAQRAAADPLDERLAGQFMLALYRCGRQAGALDHFEQVRLRLDDELGTSPSPPLRRLHHQILTADPVLAVPSATVSVARSAMPRQLPAPPRSFTGRAGQLAALSSAVDAQSDQCATMAISAIGGTGGMGKTWLALRWAHDNLDRFPDGQLCVNLRGYDPSGQPVPPAAAVRGLLDALAVDPSAIPAGLDGQVALYRRLVAGRRMLILLDNARDTAQVTPLLPATSTCVVLVTSRHRLGGLIAAHGARPLTLDVLTDTEARELLGRHLGTRVAREPGPVTALIEQCAGLPLALGIVAARAALQPELPLTALADELRESSARLDALDAGELAANVRAVLSWSSHALPPAAAQLFALLGGAPGPDISLAATASLAALSTPRTRVLVRELANAHLVHEHLPGRYRMHDLVRLYAAEQTATVDTRTAVHRLLDHYLHTACAADRLLDPHRTPITPVAAQPGVAPVHLIDHGQALAWFTAEHAALLAAFRQPTCDVLPVHTWQLAWAFATFCYRQGHWNDWADSNLAALAAAERIDDRTGRAHAHWGIARAYTYLDRNADAGPHARCALDLFTALGDQIGQADTYRCLARVNARQHRFRPALGYAQQSLVLYRSAGHRHGQATALNAIGWFHAHRGDLHQALEYCQRSLLLYRQLGNPHSTADTLDSLGYIHRHLGHHHTAVNCYQSAVELYRGGGDRYQEANTSASLGDTHHVAGDTGSARLAWQHALRILDELSHPDADHVRTRLDTGPPPQAGEPGRPYQRRHAG